MTTITTIRERLEYVIGLSQVLSREIETGGAFERSARSLLPSLHRCRKALMRDAEVGFDKEGNRIGCTPLLSDTKGPWDFAEPGDER